MRIAVIEHSKAGDYAEYIYSLLDDKAKENNYVVKTWSNSVPAFQQKVEDDTIIYISIGNTSQFLLSWMYSVKIPSILKKTNAELVLDLNGVASSKIKIPQLLITDQYLFNKEHQSLNSIEKYAKKSFKDSLKLAKNLIAYSNKKFENETSLKANAIQFLPFTSPEIFKTFEWHDKIMVKAQHADNKEYFLAVIGDNATNDFVTLLQAFSKFKKWQQSSMQLLILAKHETFDVNILAKHKTYKHREDVRLLDDIDEKQIAAIFASAAAFIHISSSEPNLLMLSIALQCSLPIISPADDDVNEYANDAALYYDEKDSAALGDKIIQLYKNENLQAELKANAQKQSALLNRKDAADKLWHLLQAATIV